MAAAISPGEAAVVAAGFAFASHIVPWLGKMVGQRRLNSQRMSLQAIRDDADRLDSSYKRLEAENARLWNRVQSLETAIGVERDMREQHRIAWEGERAEHERFRKRCDKLEYAMRKLGHMPPAEDESE